MGFTGGIILLAIALAMIFFGKARKGGGFADLPRLDRWASFCNVGNGNWRLWRRSNYRELALLRAHPYGLLRELSH
jgi:hypothetical protein